MASDKNALAQRGDALAGQRGSGKCSDPVKRRRGGLRLSQILLNQITLVHCNQRGTALDGGEQTVFLVVERLRGVEHNENQRRIGQRFAAAADAELLRLFQIYLRAFAALAQTGRVDQLDGNAAERDAFRDQVARGAGVRGHNGAVALHQPVEKRALAHVGTAHDGQRQSIVNDAAARERGFERG